ncbi:MAG: hypothetical protein ACQES9_12265 [Myxococcota bacterium]
MPANIIKFNLPASKSLTQRYLIMAALADSPSFLSFPSTCADSQDLIKALSRLGIIFKMQTGGIEIYPGQLQFPAQPVFCRDGATTARFLAAFSLLKAEPLSLTGSWQLKARPMGEFFTLLKNSGVQVDTPEKKSHLPCHLYKTRGIPARLEVDCSRSSQFLSALLLVSSQFQNPVTFLWTNPVSEAYIKMTLAVLDEFKIFFQSVPGGVKVFPGSYSGKKITNEPDLSLYPFAILAQEFSSPSVEICWNNQPFQDKWFNSKQGDKIFKSWYRQLGTGRKEFNLKATPDLFPPLLLAGIVKKKQLYLEGVSHLRYKESNRGLVLARELAKFGIELKMREDRIELVRPDFNSRKNIQVDPGSDHRLAMFFELFSLVFPGKIIITNKECTEKSWPGFWKEMRKLN